MLKQQKTETKNTGKRHKPMRVWQDFTILGKKRKLSLVNWFMCLLLKHLRLVFTYCSAQRNNKHPLAASTS